MADTYVNDNTTWRIAHSIYVNDNTTWRRSKYVYVNDGGVWRTVHKGVLFESTLTMETIGSAPNDTHGYIKALIGAMSAPTDIDSSGMEIIELWAGTSGSPTTSLTITGAASGAQAATWEQIVVNGVTRTSASADFYSDSGPVSTQWSWNGDVFGLIALSDSTVINIRLSRP